MSDGLRVKGFMARPSSAQEKLPCVIWNRGGNREFGALNDQLATLFLSRIASWGYVVVASQYRGNGGGEAKSNLVARMLPMCSTYSIVRPVPTSGCLKNCDGGLESRRVDDLPGSL